MDPVEYYYASKMYQREMLQKAEKERLIRMATRKRLCCRMPLGSLADWIRTRFTRRTRRAQNVGVRDMSNPCCPAAEGQSR